VRIIGGEFRRRLIDFPGTEGLRPTPDRVRETLFNWLGQTLYGKRCLDLFAGSGALSFEAASRGAETVVLVEKNRTACHFLRENISKLGCKNMELYCADGLVFPLRDRGRYNVIFLDPPFDSGYLPKVLPLLGSRLEPDGVIYVESGTIFDPGPGWRVEKRDKAGAVYYQLLKLEKEAVQ
jgi:16S rRNA (guanine966-N2)-methyltransferase